MIQTRFRLVLAGIAFSLVVPGVGMAGEIQGKVAAVGMRSPENIAVYIEAVPGKQFPPPAKHALMDQKNLKFEPHVLVVLKGTTVDFLNSDSVLHNVFWPEIGKNKKLAHNMGSWPQGVRKSFPFDNVGAVPLLCNVHPEMSGYIIVVPTPYFALTNSEGHYEIKDVPAGKYTLTTWSEEGKPVTQTVDVASGAVVLNLSVHR